MESNCNSVDVTGQMAQPWLFMMMKANKNNKYLSSSSSYSTTALFGLGFLKDPWIFIKNGEFIEDFSRYV
jgi:hypothetical protein